MVRFPMNEILIVIPAKGHSTVLPRKNLAQVAGRPLLWYTLDFIRQIKEGPRSLVITDDDEIETFVRDEGKGIQVIREPRVVPEEENTIRAAYRAVQAASAEDIRFSKVVILPPTQPIRPMDIVERCAAAVHGEADASASMHQSPHFPEFISSLDANGIARFGPLKRRQEYEPIFVLNGVCTAYQRAVLQEEPGTMETFHAERTYRGVVMESFPWVDIDEQADLELFEMLLRAGKTIW